MILLVDNRNILLAARILRSGGVIVYPTDTAYALGGIFNNKKAIKKILAIKQRKDEKFTLIASSLRQVEKFFSLNAQEKKLARKYWPGPLSLIVSNKYAVRVPKNEVARKLAQLAKKPLIATSANIHGGKTPYSVKEILRLSKTSPGRLFDDSVIDVIARTAGRQRENNAAIPEINEIATSPRGGAPRNDNYRTASKGKNSPLTKGRRGGVRRTRKSLPPLAPPYKGGENGQYQFIPDLILDAGRLPKLKPSTIVRVSRRGKLEIIRQGPIFIK